MIDKVEVGKKYRLINKEGYVSHPLLGNYNRQLIADKDIFDENICVVISRVNRGCGISNGVEVISTNEYHLFELVEENVMNSKEPKVITPETEVTITTTYGELARAYYVMGKANGKIHGNSLWTDISNLLGDTNRTIYWKNEPEHPTINYHLIQEEWESQIFRTKEIAIKQKRKMIAQLEEEIKQLES